jgi:hypothetical protein
VVCWRWEKRSRTHEEETSCDCTPRSTHFCGINLPARSLSVCIVHQDGDILGHRTRPAAPAPVLKAVAPSRDGLVVAVECLCTGYGLADLGADDGLPCVLGPALSLTASHGGTAQNDRSDSQQSAALLRGGMLPPASGSPAVRRATHGLLRRRLPLRRQHAARLAPVHTTNRQYHRPEMGQQSASTATREGGAARLHDPAVPQTLAVALARSTSDDARRIALALSIVQTAPQHEANPLSLHQPVPGIGTVLRLVRLSAIPRLARCPSGPDGASAARLGTCRQEASGKRLGPAGHTRGNAPLQGAVSAAAVRCLRTHEPGQTSLARLATPPDNGPALRLQAPPRGWAVSAMRTRQRAVDMAVFLPSLRAPSGGTWRRTGHPGEAPESSVRAVLVAGVCARPRDASALSPCA